MHVLESLDVPAKFPNPVLTIGNYDGVHVGHRAIIDLVKRRARQINGTPMLMTFHPHPLHVLRPDKEIPYITPITEKKRLIEEAGIEVLFVLPFTEELSQLSPESFVRDILVEKLGVKKVVVGYDFKFGKGGRGDIDGIGKYAGSYGFSLEVVDAVTIGGEKVGSNKIRKLLRSGEIDKANALLGRPYMISGQVVHGEGRGQRIGFPTINMKTDFDLVPPNGVYVTEVEVLGRRSHSATNIGNVPTFGGQERTIETFILDWKGDLYCETVPLFFHLRLREEVRFKNVTELQEQIERDVRAVRQYFSAPPLR